MMLMIPGSCSMIRGSINTSTSATQPIRGLPVWCLPQPILPTRGSSLERTARPPQRSWILCLSDPRCPSRSPGIDGIGQGCSYRLRHRYIRWVIIVLCRTLPAAEVHRKTVAVNGNTDIWQRRQPVLTTFIRLAYRLSRQTRFLLCNTPSFTIHTEAKNTPSSL